MNAELAVAALGWFALAAGHTAIGFRRVLPNLNRARLPTDSAGPPALTLNMLRFTWHIVSVVLLSFGVLFATLAFAPHAGAKVLLLRWCAGFLLVSTALACWQGRRRPRSLLRPPVALVFVAIAAICVAAST